MTVPDASAATKAAQDGIVKAERSILLAAEFARYALEDYAHRPDIAALLDALTTYQAATTAREDAGTALINALTKALDR